MRDAPLLLPDPSPCLTAAFRAVSARMQGLSCVNPAVDVEAVGFAPWERHWLGVMVTPWCMNLVLLPRDPVAWYPLAPGSKRRYPFPAGTYEFVGANDPAIGDYQVCSLYSPLLEFDDHETARLVASLARGALFDPAHAEAPDVPAAAGAPAASEPPATGPLDRLRARLDTPVSRRDLLHGRSLSKGP